jgi:1-acyl-sn-glycerol-3-phosphate acyltransferase
MSVATKNQGNLGKMTPAKAFRRAIKSLFVTGLIAMISGSSLGALYGLVAGHFHFAYAGTVGTDAGYGFIAVAIGVAISEMLWGKIKRWAFIIAGVEFAIGLIALIFGLPGAMLGGAAGYFASAPAADALIGAYVGWGVLVACVAILFIKKFPGEFRKKTLIFTGLEALCSLASLIFGVPGAIIGGVVGSYFFAAPVEGALFGYLPGGLFCAGRLLYWDSVGRKLQTPGYLQPYPTKFERIIYVWLCRQILTISLGPNVVYGQERAKFEGSMFIGGNHQSGADFILARVSMPFSFRQITQMRQLVGLQRALGAFSGAFGVQSEGGKSKGNAEAVIDACAGALARAQRSKLLIYPQGTLILRKIDENDFRTGVIRMMERYTTLTKDGAVCFLPEAIRYWDAEDYRKAMGHRPDALREFLSSGWPHFDKDGTKKYGATVVIGDPIPLATMPRNADGTVDLRASINLVAAAVAELYAEADVRTDSDNNATCDKLRAIGLHGIAMRRLLNAGLFTNEKLANASVAELTAAGLSDAQAASVEAGKASFRS